VCDVHVAVLVCTTDTHNRIPLSLSLYTLELDF
jgi:hypothetical protein